MNTIDALEFGDKMLASTVSTLVELDWFSPEYWYKPGVCGQWSAKDTIAHLSAFETLLTDVLISLEAGAITPDFALYLADPDHFNLIQIASRQDKSVGELLAEYEQAHALNRSWLPQIAEEKLNQPHPWFNVEQSPADFIVYAAYTHKREHIAQIMAFIRHHTSQTESTRHKASEPLSVALNRIFTFARG
jgi:hypothetical protein